VLHYTRPDRLVRENCSCLLVPFTSFEEKEELCTTPATMCTTLDFLYNISMGGVQTLVNYLRKMLYINGPSLVLFKCVSNCKMQLLAVMGMTGQVWEKLGKARLG
jgi:hypothetical protein